MPSLPDIIAAEKSIAYFPGWSEPEPETGYIWFDAPIEIDGITEAGLFLHGGAVKNRPDRHVTLELSLRAPNGPRRIPLCRVEWRSLNGGHTNRRKYNSLGVSRRVGTTHIHPFELNWVDAEQRMRRGNLPVAVPIDVELQTFESVCGYVGKALGINNIGVVAIPAWEYSFDYG